MHLFSGAAAKRQQQAQQPGPDADVVKDGSLRTFAQDVIAASQRVPVLVDFWAPWCGPCKQLTPVLEKVVRSAKGKVRLVKINIDENPEIAQQLRIQSVPTVYAFVQGQPVTGFAGAQPESQVRLLVERLLGGDAGGADLADALEQAKAAAEAGDTRTAQQLYEAVLDEDPANADAVGGLARCLIAARALEDARQLLDALPKDLETHPAISGAKAALQLAGESGDLGDPRQLQARLERDADDHAARYGLATALFLRGQAEAAMEHLVQIVRRDRGWNEDQARKQLVRFFEALGPKHPATLKGRRMLSTVLFS